MGQPLIIDLRRWHPIELTRERRASEAPLTARPGEINAEQGGNALWVCEMSHGVPADGTTPRDMLNTSWFWLEGPK